MASRKMKALTIKQPWADLIVSGIKDIENRTWRTKFRGRIYVHASQKHACDKWEIPHLLNDQQLDSLNSDQEHELVNGIWLKSSIIGEVEIVDCVLNHSSIWAEKMEYDVCPETGLHILRKDQKYIWNWVLANPVKYKNPIQGVIGSLSFWEYERRT